MIQARTNGDAVVFEIEGDGQQVTDEAAVLLSEAARHAHNAAKAAGRQLSASEALLSIAALGLQLLLEQSKGEAAELAAAVERRERKLLQLLPASARAATPPS